jgi:uncharacterized repeat protein (TIGR03803 family)
MTRSYTQTSMSVMATFRQSTKAQAGVRLVPFEGPSGVFQSRRKTTVISKRLCRAASVAATFLVAILAAQSAQAQTYKVLHAFTGGADGHTPWAGVIQDGKGNLYGTTQYGGPTDAGTVFRLNKTTGKETVLYSFCTATNCPDGSAPEAGVIQDAQGNLYGTTTAGGNCVGFRNPGCGVVFKVNKAGQETVLYSFLGMPDAGVPEWADGVIRDANGNLYGDFLQIRNRPYLNRSKSILKAWLL